MSKYEFLKCEYSFRNVGNGGSYDFFLNDSRNDYNRILKAFENGVFVISGCRSMFEKDTIEGITNQLDMFNIPYDESEITKLDNLNCDINSGVYKHLLARYNAYTTKQLETDLRNMGYGFRASIGGFKEENSATSQKEFSFVVPFPNEKMEPEKFLEDAVALCKKYIQDSVLFAHPYFENGRAMWVNKDTQANTFMKSSKPRLSNSNEYFTETKKSNSKSFTLDPDWDTEGQNKTIEKSVVDNKVIDVEKISNNLAKYRLIPSSQRDPLNAIYEENGWTRRG